ncbi:MAG TPA: formylmethanofuran dehydrogenase subunit C [Gemmatimonadaceae bacterium]|nr:formylmethanofuran dehydrogenase subunit C [Gemmatimonadaceae bacterium]
MTLVLTLRPGITERIDASAMATNSTCWVGRRRVSVGELFDVKGEPGPDVRITGDLRRVDGLGTGMSAGMLTIEGEAGRGVGHAMSGGTIDVTGSVGDGAGVAMSGGLLRIRGSAGDRLGAPLPGASRGMTGGEIIVRGNVGSGAATRVRRGLVIVGGNAGANAAHAMIAGTMLVAGRLGTGAGLWSKRGSVIALGGVEVPATYRYACTYRPPYVPVLLRYLQRMRGFTIDGRFASGRYKRWTGDVADVGKGEILEWTT